MPRIKAIGLLAILLICCGIPTARAEIKVGQQFPDLGTFKLEGNLPALSKTNVVLVDFWASWCGPCAQSFPTMQQLNKTYGPRGLIIVAVNEDDQKANMEHFLQYHSVSFCVVRDAMHTLVSQADVSDMPSSFLIDGNGKIAFAHNGFHGSETRQQYQSEIESLLKQAQK
ncbi:MAG TPA: TlpA disulfide reductase family protein [Verrucomicrobiae bacterium]|nr:TlpA disulfide reductase family protein [Verrucomicrobiae bacterium]